MNIRSQIRQSVKEDLARITEANGFNMTIVQVHQSTPDISDIVNFPSVALSALGERIKYTGEGVKEHYASYAIVGFYTVPADGDYEQEAENFYDDVLTLFSGDCALDSLPLESVELTTFEPYPDAEGKAFVVIKLNIIYIQ